MGRELKRKQAKQEGKNVREVQRQKQDIENNSVTLNKFITLIVCMMIFFVILYLITGLFVTKDIKWFSKNNKTEESDKIDNEILASTSLKQAEEVYYVYFYDTEKEDSTASNKVSSISDKVYRVNLSNGFNSSYVGEASGVVTEIEKLKVTNPTVIKVESGKMVAFYNGTSEIENIE